MLADTTACREKRADDSREWGRKKTVLAIGE